MPDQTTQTTQTNQESQTKTTKEIEQLAFPTADGIAVFDGTEYVKHATARTITAQHDFSNGIKINGVLVRVE